MAGRVSTLKKGLTIKQREDKQVSIVQLSKDRQARVEWTEWNGKVKLDVRLWYLDEGDVWKPSKQGFRVPADKVQEFAKMVAEETGGTEG